MSDKKFVLITGAGKGLGKAFARQCAEMGFNMILLALPGENTHSLARHIQHQFEVEVLVYELDMCDEQRLADTLKEISDRYQVFFLINNAGIGGTASITTTSFQALDRIISLNVKAGVQVTTAMIPVLSQFTESYILNVASMAAFAPIAYKTVYPASKAFIASFSMGLREELKEQGISVSILYPGPIMTNCNVSGRILAQGFIARMGLINTDAIARAAIRKCLNKKARIVPGIWNRVTAKLLEWLPADTALHLISSSVKRELSYNF